MVPIMVEKFSDMVMEHNKDLQLQRTDCDPESHPGRQEKRRQVHDLWPSYLGGRHRHHRYQYGLYLRH